MVHRTYQGLGPPDAAVRAFADLRPYAEQLFALQADCAPLGPDHMALGIAIDGLEAAAYHFTRRPRFYDDLRSDGGEGGGATHRLGDRQEALRAFEALAPYAAQLRDLQGRCRPFGRDYLALDIALQSLESAAYHFTRIGGFYGARRDSAGPVRPHG